MTKPFEYAGHTYTFQRNGSEVIPIRDDNARPWSTYSAYTVKDGKAYPSVHSYSPALATVTECKQLITGDTRTMTTSVHRVVWAATAYEAQRIREHEDANKLPPDG